MSDLAVVIIFAVLAGLSIAGLITEEVAWRRKQKLPGPRESNPDHQAESKRYRMLDEVKIQRDRLRRMPARGRGRPKPGGH